MTPKSIQRAIDAELAAIQRHREGILRSEARLVALRELLRLQSVSSNSIVSSEMEAAHRVAISSGRTSAIESEDAAFLKHIQERGYSLRKLAAKIKVSQPTLSAHRKPKAHPNSRPCPQSRADRVRELTDWPADAKHWPAGLTADRA